jgi:hypothetical protein
VGRHGTVAVQKAGTTEKLTDADLSDLVEFVKIL